MKSTISGAIVFALLAGTAASAQPAGHGNRHSANGNHSDRGLHRGWVKDRGSKHRWNRGERMGYNDWNSAPRVEYRRYRLRAPPRGYEWRRKNDQFILVAVATGLIASIILHSGR